MLPARRAKADARTSGDREHAQTRKKKRDFLRGGDSGSCILACTLPRAACLSVRLHTSSATESGKDSKHYINHHQILLITLTYTGIGAPVATTTPKDALYSKTKRLRNKQV